MIEYKILQILEQIFVSKKHKNLFWKMFQRYKKFI